MTPRAGKEVVVNDIETDLSCDAPRLSLWRSTWPGRKKVGTVPWPAMLNIWYVIFKSCFPASVTPRREYNPEGALSRKFRFAQLYHVHIVKFVKSTSNTCGGRGAFWTPKRVARVNRWII
jgi:hypothetical protein